MVQIDTKVQNKNSSLLQSPYTYNEIIHYLDTHWSPTANLVAISQLDESFGFPSKKLDIATVSGTSGKSTTIHYTCKLLEEEGLKVGAFYTPHLILYNERFAINNEQISNKTFTQLANKVIQTALDKKIAASTKDILTMMAFLFFKDSDVNLAIFENSGTYNLDPVLYCDVKIAAVTRIVANTNHDDTPAAFTNIVSPLTSKTYFVSADQNKQNLQIMHQLIQSKGSIWLMPIRKIAPLEYPLEQLHGRCAALAERIAHVYSDNFLHKDQAGAVNVPGCWYLNHCDERLHAGYRRSFRPGLFEFDHLDGQKPDPPKDPDSDLYPDHCHLGNGDRYGPGGLSARGLRQDGNICQTDRGLCHHYDASGDVCLQGAGRGVVLGRSRHGARLHDRDDDDRSGP